MKYDKLNREIVEEITQLGNSFFQDLAFLALSTPLDHTALKQNQKFDLKAKLETIRLLLERATDIPDKGEYERQPLGKYAESLLHFYFLHHPDWELLAENMQLNQEGISKGEIDFLLYHRKEKTYIHLELALKYYLKTKLNRKVIFLGPSTKDWFSRKIKKLQEHQLQLLSTYPELMKSSWAHLEFKPKHLIKGSLFYPWRELLSKMDHKSFSSAWWCSFEEFEKLPLSAYGKLITDKKDWIFPFKADKLLPHQSVMEQLKSLFAEGRNELMLVRYDENGKVMDHGFVVRNHWPN